MNNRKSFAAGVVVSALVLSSCNALNVSAIPVPGASTHDGYDVVMEFSNVLNLPDRAKVLMDGTRVGTVTGVHLVGQGVEVTSQIQQGIVVPSDIRAVLQQGTVLGDTYVALERTDHAAAATRALQPGGRIPLSQTVSSPQLEDTLASLANFIGSGSIQRAQRTVIGVNRVTPALPEVREIALRVATDMADLSNNIETVDRWLEGVAGTADVLGRYAPNLQFWFSPQGVMGFHHLFPLSHYFATLLPSVGTIYYNGYWLVPVLESGAQALETFQRTKMTVDQELPHWYNLIKDYYMPERKYPAINITSIVDSSDGRELSGNVEQVLRMLGAMP